MKQWVLRALFAALVLLLVVVAAEGIGLAAGRVDAQTPNGNAAQRIEKLQRRVTQLEGSVAAIQDQLHQVGIDGYCTGNDLVTGSDKLDCRIARIEDRLGM